MLQKNYSDIYCQINLVWRNINCTQIYTHTERASEREREFPCNKSFYTTLLENGRTNELGNSDAIQKEEPFNFDGNP